MNWKKRVRFLKFFVQINNAVCYVVMTYHCPKKFISCQISSRLPTFHHLVDQSTYCTENEISSFSVNMNKPTVDLFIFIKEILKGKLRTKVCLKLSQQ